MTGSDWNMIPAYLLVGTHTRAGGGDGDGSTISDTTLSPVIQTQPLDPGSVGYWKMFSVASLMWLQTYSPDTIVSEQPQKFVI